MVGQKTTLVTFPKNN